MFSSLTLVSLFSLIYSATASPAACFNAKFELLAFGLGGKDWNAGTQDSWGSGTANDITTSGRPPFDGANTTCYTAQFYNAIYILNGDASNPSAVHIYDAGSNAWSTQSVTTGDFDPSSFDAILDHDTNVFYALSKGELFFLRMGSLITANATAIEWQDVQKAPFADGYQPVMALAQNHVHFLDVPGLPAGSANIFVIHYSSFQSDPQSYPASDGSNTFPAVHGQTTSFFQETGVQQEFAFIPDDGSATYVVNVETNTTTSLAGPTTKDAGAKYSASITALVQLDSKGSFSFLPYKQGDAATNSKASWQSIANLASIPTTSASSSGNSSSSSNSSSSPSGSKTAASSGASATGNSSSGASGNASGATSLSFPVITIAFSGILGLAAMLL